ncbi:MAG: diguanylate cyclase, partial [Janthinobacterium sp.]
MIWNRACEQLTGVPATEVLHTREPGRCFYNDERPTLADLVLAGRGGDMRTLHAQQQYRSSTGSNLCAENWCDMPRTGRRRYLAVDASPIYGNHGELIAVVETLRDMTDEKRAQVELERLATRDGLTGLANRRGMAAALDDWQAQARPFSVIAIDIDHFKQVNDQWGHAVGDDVILRLAQLMRACSRDADVLCRNGGDEFIMLLPDADLDVAMQVAERLRAKVAAAVIPGAGAITVSLGVVSSSHRDRGTDAVLLAADAALYVAKENGRNCVGITEPA